MFDANSEREDDGEEYRAIVILTVDYSGISCIEFDIDPGDEALVADQLRSIPDDLCGEGETRH